ncbi:MAG: hypothetical protein HOH61_02055 [Rhodospirillaceae bacterium]|nr:hypothetical protein [Rhodospirillaceae bacterium]
MAGHRDLIQFALLARLFYAFDICRRLVTVTVQGPLLAISQVINGETAFFAVPDFFPGDANRIALDPPFAGIFEIANLYVGGAILCIINFAAGAL